MSKTKGLIFIHIPKTAGTTLHGIITREYSSEKHYGVSNLPSMSIFNALEEKERHRYSVIRGHLDTSLLPYARPGLPVITFLRNPAKRIISAYEFIYKSKRHKFHAEMHKNQYSLFDFLNNKYVKNFDNGQVRFLSGAHNEEFGMINETHLALAKHNLDHLITAYGISERFDESIVYLSKKLGWKTPLYTTLNVAKQKTSKKHLEDLKTVEKIKECSFYDEQLYEYASIKLESLFVQAGDDFQKEVETFKQLNAHKSLWFKLSQFYFLSRIIRPSNKL